MKKKKVLLLAPSLMNIYKDIISGLEAKNFEVVWVQDGQIKGIPYNKRDINRKTKTVEEYEKAVNSFWDKKFKELSFYGELDYFFAIDGMMVSHYFFEQLRRQNPSIKTLLYLYDKIENNYELNIFFKHYDDIFTFEKSDSIKYQIKHLPIYWAPIQGANEEVYDIFGMASYKACMRYEIFTKVKTMAKAEGLKENISLYYPHVNSKVLYQLKYSFKRLMGKDMLPLSHLHNDVFTEHIMTPDQFRENIRISRVILDTHNTFQDGLTARFMWAIGMGKKIITTNDNISGYSFYDPDQILILNNNYCDIVPFIQAPFEMKSVVKNQILNFRIDNWLNTLLN